MIDTRQIDKIFTAVNRFIPVSAASDEIKQNVKQALVSVLNDMDIVTRDEFEAQSRILLKTRHKLEALEKKLQDYEKKPD